MGLYQKAKKHIYEKKINILDTLHERNFRSVFKEDEKSIGLILKEYRILLKKNEESSKYISNFISSLISNDTINLTKQNIEKKFISILKEIIDIDSLLFYKFDGQHYTLSEQSQKTFEWTKGISHIDNKEIIVDNLNKENKNNIIEIDFLSILENSNIEKPENILSSYLKGICVLDEHYKCSSLFVFTSKDSNFNQEHNIDFLKIFSYMLDTFYNKSKEIEIDEEKEINIENNKASIFEYIQSIIDSDESVFINTFKLKYFKIPKKQQDNYIEIYKKIDQLLIDINIKNIINIGSHNYIVISKSSEQSKLVSNILKKTKTTLKNKVLNSINFHMNSLKFPDKKFNSSFDFISNISFLLDTGEKQKINTTTAKKKSQEKTTNKKVIDKKENKKSVKKEKN